MIVLTSGESLRVPATVQGDKALITSIEASIKRSQRGEVPAESSPAVATLAVSDFNSAEITNGYMFSLVNTSALTVGTYYINFKYVVDGVYTYKGDPMKVLIKESVV